MIPLCVVVSPFQNFEKLGFFVANKDWVTCFKPKGFGMYKGHSILGKKKRHTTIVQSTTAIITPYLKVAEQAVGTNEPWQVPVEHANSPEIPLEGDGLLELVLVFKQSQVVGGKKRFKHLYKIECQNFADFLYENMLNWITSRHSSSDLNASNILVKVAKLHQEFTCVVNGQKFSLSLEEPPMGSTGPRYLRWVLYQIMLEYYRFYTPQNKIPENQYKTSKGLNMEALSSIQGFDTDLAMTGLLANSPYSNLAVTRVRQKAATTTLNRETVITGRTRIIPTRQKSAPLMINQSSPGNLFDSMVALPAGFTILEGSGLNLNATQDPTLNPSASMPLRTADVIIKELEQLITRQEAFIFSAEQKVNFYKNQLKTALTAVKTFKAKLDPTSSSYSLSEEERQVYFDQVAETESKILEYNKQILEFERQIQEFNTNLATYQNQKFSLEKNPENAKLETSLNKFYLNEDETSSVIKAENPVLHQVVIEDRRTIFQLNYREKEETMEQTSPYLNFSFFEDSVKYNQLAVCPRYLTALINSSLLNPISEVLSKDLKFNQVFITTTMAKKWDNTGSCEKQDLQVLFQKSYDCSLELSGSNSSSVVNNGYQLVFSAKFEGETNDQRTQRLIGNTVFKNISEVQLNSEKIKAIRYALKSEIILSHEPLVKLVPVFERGTKFRKASDVVFRGFSPNARGDKGVSKPLNNLVGSSDEEP